MNLNVFLVKNKLEIVMGLLFVFLAIAPVALVMSSNIVAKEAQKTGKKPLVELHDFTYAEVDKLGVNKVVLGSVGYHFADYEQIFDINFRQKNKESIQTLSAKKAEKKDKILYFSGNVKCDNGNGAVLNTDMAEYAETTKTLKITKNFVATSDKYTIFGDRSTVWDNGKKIKAVNIKVKMHTEDK